MTKYFFLLIQILYIFIWILLCSALALIGLLLPIQSKEINLQQVIDVDTICSVLHRKGKLSEEDYNFEHQIVAPCYDDFTFLGYLFIMKPFIYNLKKNQYFDGAFEYLVPKWILAHKNKKNEATNLVYIYQIISRTSTRIAFLVGRSLMFKWSK